MGPNMFVDIYRKVSIRGAQPNRGAPKASAVWHEIEAPPPPKWAKMTRNKHESQALEWLNLPSPLLLSFKVIRTKVVSINPFYT